MNAVFALGNRASSEEIRGVTGSNLRRRLRAIMTQRKTEQIGLRKNLLLAAAGMVVVVGPIVLGVLNTPEIRAQSAAPATPKFEVASIKACKDGNGGGRGGGAGEELSSPGRVHIACVCDKAHRDGILSVWERP